MSAPRKTLILGALLLATSAANAADGCKLLVFAELPVTMAGLQPMVAAKINGVEAQFLLDSGAFYSMLNPSAVTQFKLPTRLVPTGYRLEGVGGSMIPHIATVATFSLAEFPLHNSMFLVGTSDLGGGVVGLFGENLMRVGDVEFDFANHVLRLIKAENCKGSLAYWAKPGEPFGVVDLNTPSPANPIPSGFAYVNGVKVRVVFDTGAYTSILSLAAAKEAGISPNSPDVKPAGSVYGISHDTVHVWSAPVASFKVGGEEIQHTRVLIGDTQVPDTDMLIGADFFHSHRVFLANGQKKIYFTYNGGPVFDLEGQHPAPPPPAAK